MTRVVVIEDRTLILQALRESIAWADNGLEPAGFFESCDRALPFILAEKPDVVVTDIVMHGMSGIDLCERIREAGLDTQLIIISAYSKFEYAHKALQMGVFDYFEKPVDFDALVQSICRAGAERRNAEQMRQYVANHMELYRERFFVKLLSGQIRDEEMVRSEAAFLRLDGDKRMCCLTLRVYPMRNDDVRRGVRREMSFHALYRRLEEALGRGSMLGPFSLGENDMTLVLLSGLAYQGAPDAASEAISEALEEFSRIEKLRVHAGLGREVSSLSQLKGSYDCALEAAEACFVFKDSALLSEEDIPPRGDHQWQAFIQFEEALMKALRQEDAQATVAAFGCLRSGLRESYIQRDSLKTLMRGTLIRMQAAYPLEVSCFKKTEAALEGADSVDELLEVVQRHAACICETIRDSNVSERVRLFSMMRAYVQQHYSDPQFSLAELSRHVALSPNYVSSLFKKEHGCGLHEYVTELRIEQARRLLTQTDLSIARIGEMVGYPNAYYFSVSFKKCTRYTPTEYRKKNQEI